MEGAEEAERVTRPLLSLSLLDLNTCLFWVRQAVWTQLVQQER